jgi:hypothetical protein
VRVEREVEKEKEIFFDCKRGLLLEKRFPQKVALLVQLLEGGRSLSLIS